MIDGVREYDIAEMMGPYTWGILHHAIESFPCGPCAHDGGRLMRGLHDVVNSMLGKSLFAPKDLEFLAGHVADAMHELPVAVVHKKDLSSIEAEARRLAQKAGFLSVGQLTQLQDLGELELTIFPKCGSVDEAKIESCVEQIKKQAGGASPFAVCTASVGCTPAR